MTPARERLARQYVYDMINSFVEDPYSGNAYMEYDPPSVSFYSPDIELLLKKACYNDLYSVKHPEFAMHYGVDNRLYDIDGHRVWTISGTVNIYINGVAFDQLELDRWKGYINMANKGGSAKTREGSFASLPGQLRCSQTSKFHVRLPPHPK